MVDYRVGPETTMLQPHKLYSTLVDSSPLLPEEEPGAMHKQPSVPWVPSNDDVVETIVNVLKPRPTDVFYDIGCGDGRVAVAVAERHRIRTVCIELRPDLVRKARETVAAKRLTWLVKVVEADFYDEHLGDATILYMYLLTSVNQKLRPKLEKELQDATVILTLDFPIPGWRTVGIIELPRAWQKTIYLYVKGFSDEGRKDVLDEALERVNRSRFRILDYRA